MSNDILDNLAGISKRIRKPYYTIIEFLIVGLNAFFVLGGLFLVLSSVITRMKNGEFSFMTAIATPTIMISFSLPPILYIYNWRTSSIEYEQHEGAKKIVKKLSDMMDFIHIIAGALWTIIFSLCCLFFISLILGFGIDRTFSNALSMFFITVFFAILGPVQYLYVRMINKVYKELP